MSRMESADVEKPTLGCVTLIFAVVCKGMKNKIRLDNNDLQYGLRTVYSESIGLT